MGLGIPDEFLENFASLGIHGAMALIILGQIILMVRALGLVKKFMGIFRDQVIPLATNHLTHIEASFNDLSTQAVLQRENIKAHTAALESNTKMIELQGSLLRELVETIRTRKR